MENQKDTNLQCKKNETFTAIQYSNSNTQAERKLCFLTPFNEESFSARMKIKQKMISTNHKNLIYVYISSHEIT